MWTDGASYSSAGIQAKSSYNDTAEANCIDAHFSLGIFFSTYESRGLLSSTLLRPKSCQRSVIVLFKEKDTEGLRDKHDLLLISQVKECSIEEPVIIANFSVRQVEDTLQSIIAVSAVARTSFEDRWFLDISGSPKPYFLGLLGYLRTLVVAPMLTIFHPTGHYEKLASPKEAFSFTAGFDRYMWVPWFWGKPDPTMPWTYLFLLGFEGHRAYEIYTRFEPSSVMALIGRPGYFPNYVEKAESENSKFIDEAKPSLIYANAADPVETWRNLVIALASENRHSNLCIVPLGPKPHALGAGLLAMADGMPSVLYLMPRTFRVRDVPPGPRVWMYDICL